jgi:low temperature requirement protein LtrA
MHSIQSVPIVSPDDQRVTWVELFFDLVFVFCVTQVVTLLHGHIDWRTAGSALIVFWLVWWAWTQFTWALNAANTEHPRIQAIMLLGTAIAFLLAVGIPSALTEETLWFAGPYVVLRVIGLALYAWVASNDPLQRAAVRIFSLVSTSGLAAVLIGAWVGGAALYWCWAGAIVLDLAAAAIGGQREGWNLHPTHFAERHGLIVIIALGETLIVAASRWVEATRSPIMIATGGLALAVTGGLWWSYFRHARELLEHALSARKGNARSSLARDAFSVLHFPMLCGVIAIAAATEAALAHPAETLGADLRVGLGVGTALFVCGTAAGLWRATGQVLPWRWALGVPIAALLFWLEAVPWILLGLVAAVLVVIALIEHRRFRTSADEHIGW